MSFSSLVPKFLGISLAIMKNWVVAISAFGITTGTDKSYVYFIKWSMESFSQSLQIVYKCNDFVKITKKLVL